VNLDDRRDIGSLRVTTPAVVNDASLVPWRDMPVFDH
jgi:hypothetical protein